MSRWWIAGAIVAAGCYAPNRERVCSVACNSVDGCPSGQVCGGNGVCRTADMDDCPLTLPDAPPGDGESPVCFEAPHFAIQCFSPDANPVDLTGELDTDMIANCTRRVSQDNGSDLCVIHAGAISISGTFRPQGMSPLVLVADTTITVPANTAIDVASHRGGTLGVASDPGDPMCTGMTAGQSQATNRAGGGAGGSFGGLGGVSPASAMGGMPVAAFAPAGVPLRGGCRGGKGGDGPLAAAGGAGGAAGGAIYLIANTSITIDGTINASGAGGLGAATQAGGGGGGSGGMIGLAAPDLTISGLVFALGGSGGAGGKGNMGGGSAPGNDPTNPMTLTLGGVGVDSGGDGGVGSNPLTGGAGQDGGAQGGTGGGGGGGGLIFVTGQVTGSGTIAPPSS